MYIFFCKMHRHRPDKINFDIWCDWCWVVVHWNRCVCTILIFDITNLSLTEENSHVGILADQGSSVNTDGLLRCMYFFLGKQTRYVIFLMFIVQFYRQTFRCNFSACASFTPNKTCQRTKIIKKIKYVCWKKERKGKHKKLSFNVVTLHLVSFILPFQV